MARSPQAMAEDGVLACACEDRARVTTLLVELTAVLDFSHPAASTLCRVYESALAGVAAGRFTIARGLFQALLET